MATRLTKKQQGELTEKLTGIIRDSNALQLRLSADRSVNEMNVNQISGALNRIHGQAIGKELPTEINIPVKQIGSGDPTPDNVRPVVGYEIDGIGTVYGGELNIDSGVLTVTYGIVNLGLLTWTASTAVEGLFTTPITASLNMRQPNINNKANAVCSIYKIGPAPASMVATPPDDKTLVIGRPGLNNIYVRDLFYTDVASLEQAMPGVMLAYELATPETYTLTLQQMIQLLDQL